MPTDLTYLALTAILSATLWIPYIACQVMTNGFLRRPDYIDPKPRPVPAWGTRAHRAYLNAVETFAPFAALVIAGHIAGKGEAIASWAMAYFFLRVIHAVVFWLAWPWIRTVAFTLGWIVVAVIFVKVIA
jgi:uncharacterized MAPEG superfamily protein